MFRKHRPPRHERLGLPPGYGRGTQKPSTSTIERLWAHKLEIDAELERRGSTEPPTEVVEWYTTHH